MPVMTPMVLTISSRAPNEPMSPTLMRQSKPAGAKAKPKAEPCPHCTKPVKANQHRCPHCGKVVRLNSFVIEADWRPVAAAWRGES